MLNVTFKNDVILKSSSNNFKRIIIVWLKEENTF